MAEKNGIYLSIILDFRNYKSSPCMYGETTKREDSQSARLIKEIKSLDAIILLLNLRKHKDWWATTIKSIVIQSISPPTRIRSSVLNNKVMILVTVQFMQRSDGHIHTTVKFQMSQDAFISWIMAFRTANHPSH